MAIAVKKHAKVDIKLFLPCPILLDSLINTKYPDWDCRYPQIKQFFGKFNMASYLDLTMMPQLSYIILLIFDALLIWVLSRFVVRMIIKSANGKQWTQKKRRESKIRKKTSIWKHNIGSLNFLRTIRNSCDLPKFSYYYHVNPQTLNDARCTFFKRWLVITFFESITVVFKV